MLKMYHSQAHAGSSPDFWEENWEASDYARSVQFCAIDPIRPLFTEFLRADSLMLEGGCGVGNYVTFYSAKGYNVVGLDFAQRALKTLHKRQPQAKLCGGDVSQMPFADETFDFYYSGGVVEHFEGGATESLAEARRILKPDGVFLVSVPYFSPLRKMLRPLRKDWRVVIDAQQENNNGSGRFFQYAYTRNEFSRMLNSAGFQVVKTQGYAVLWGLYELPFVANSEGDPSAATRVESSNDITDLAVDPDTSLFKRLIVSEDASVPILGLGVKLMRWASANMMMYVCRRN